MAKLTPEGSRGLQKPHHQVEDERVIGGATWPHLETARPLGVPPINPIAMLVLHQLKDCIYAVYSSRFDPRAHVGPSGLYNQPLPPSRACYHKSRSDQKLGFPERRE